MTPVRSPAVAGQFYPDSPEQCRSQIAQCLEQADDLGVASLPPGFQPVAGIAPHAGWMCSGAVAAKVIQILASGGRGFCTAADQPDGSVSCPPAGQSVETFVVFGAAHRLPSSPAAVYARGCWETPLGEVPIDESLADRVLESGPLVSTDPGVHEMEHSIEVEVPFIQYFAPDARLLPIIVPPSALSPEVGRTVARAATQLGRRAVFLGSTDLTHYGPRYRFAPQGVGPDGVRWAREVNDRRLLELITALRAAEVVNEVGEHRNACGPGAIAATIAAAQTAGATAGHVLCHTNSNEVLCSRYGEMDDAVGYAGVILGRQADDEQRSGG